MSLLTCCSWWFVLGLLLGWLLNWLLSKWLRTDVPASPHAVVDPFVAQSVGNGSAAATSTVAAPAPSAAVSDAPETFLEEAKSSTASALRVIDVAAARTAGIDLKRSDDLTIIEGIGPKIDELLHSSGIVSFAHLARMSVPELDGILERGGPNFRLANPSTWAAQALLASENRWKELKKLQDDLIGGVDQGQS